MTQLTQVNALPGPEQIVHRAAQLPRRAKAAIIVQFILNGVVQNLFNHAMPKCEAQCQNRSRIAEQTIFQIL